MALSIDLSFPPDLSFYYNFIPCGSLFIPRWIYFIPSWRLFHELFHPPQAPFLSQFHSSWQALHSYLASDSSSPSGSIIQYFIPGGFHFNQLFIQALHLCQKSVSFPHSMCFTHSLIPYFIPLHPLSLNISSPLVYFNHNFIPLWSVFHPLPHPLLHPPQPSFIQYFIPTSTYFNLYISSPSPSLSITISFPCSRYFICTLIPHVALLF